MKGGGGSGVIGLGPGSVYYNRSTLQNPICTVGGVVDIEHPTAYFLWPTWLRHLVTPAAGSLAIVTVEIGWHDVPRVRALQRQKLRQIT